MLKSLPVRTYVLIILSVAASSCFQKGEIQLNETLAEDRDYSRIYEEYTKNREVYKDFESKYRLTVTYLAPNFRGAFSKRLKDLFTQEHPSFDEAAQKAGFFISIHSPDEKAIDLNDPHLWTIFTDIDGGRHSPLVIKRIDQKERWQPFFKDISPWSREYLIVFDAASVSPNQPEMVEKASVSLTFANADAKVTVNW